MIEAIEMIIANLNDVNHPSNIKDVRNPKSFSTILFHAMLHLYWNGTVIIIVIMVITMMTMMII